MFSRTTTRLHSSMEYPRLKMRVACCRARTMNMCFLCVFVCGFCVFVDCSKCWCRVGPHWICHIDKWWVDGEHNMPHVIFEAYSPRVVERHKTLIIIVCVSPTRSFDSIKKPIPIFYTYTSSMYSRSDSVHPKPHEIIRSFPNTFF